MSSPLPNRLCREFEQSGGCKHGEKCSFSHDLFTTSNKGHQERIPETPAEQQSRGNYNAWKRILKTAPKDNDAIVVQRLWNGALDILNGDDKNWPQWLPRDMDDDKMHGKDHIKSIMSMRTKGKAFLDLVKPFLLVISHEALLDCLAVDTAVGGIYNFISGSRGTRAIPFFQHVNDCFVAYAHEHPTSSAALKFPLSLTALLTALRELLEREQKATSHEDLLTLVDSLEALVESVPLHEQTINTHTAKNRIREVRGILARALGLETANNGPIVPSVDPLMPGNRHNNDKKDIADIAILPTAEEIRSNHAEYLPSTSLLQPHFLEDRAQRHLDTQFRLLRHDVFGELKDALGGLMQAVEKDPRILQKPKVNLGNIRGFSYPNAFISNVSYAQKRGLMAHFSFPQPPQLLNLTPPERRRWWDETRRLTSDAFLCFLYYDNGKCSMQFFSAHPPSLSMNSNSDSLCSDSLKATTTAKLGSDSQADMEAMIQLGFRGVLGVLIEFPGIISATFAPVLRNLQNMQRLGRLPFRQWVAPNEPAATTDVGSETDSATQTSPTIPPPLYARRRGFQYSLNPILRSIEYADSESSESTFDAEETIAEEVIGLFVKNVTSKGQLLELFKEKNKSDICNIEQCGPKSMIAHFSTVSRRDAVFAALPKALTIRSETNKNQPYICIFVRSTTASEKKEVAERKKNANMYKPLYLTKKQSRAENSEFFISPYASIEDEDLIDEIETRTYLDRGQCVALLAALVREVALIQGPPGTGKSFIGISLMKILLQSAKNSNLGPIIVVCYTNHALDQFLEHIIDTGVDNVIRVGGQSKSELLRSKNLRIISQEGTRSKKTKAEGFSMHKTYKELEDKQEPVNKLLNLLYRLQKKPDWDCLKEYLAYNHPTIYTQFEAQLEENDGFSLVGRTVFEKWIEGVSADSSYTFNFEHLNVIEELLIHAEQNVLSLSPGDKSYILGFWIRTIQNEKADELYELIKEIAELHRELDLVRGEIERRILETAEVIGLTTTGLAQKIDTLQHIGAKILICEEAAEIMEPHMLSALLPTVQHVISIGDHQQLRPKINNFNLSLESHEGALYQLDRSQFERLSSGEPGRPQFPVAQLNIQRRMRPAISDLIRNTLYPRLVDHDSTKVLPNVVGLRDNVFWFNHDNTEDNEERHQRVLTVKMPLEMESKSRSNEWEVSMTKALVRHIVRQGTYRSSDIAVLTPYVGQLKKLRNTLGEDFEVQLSDLDEEELIKNGLEEAGEVSSGTVNTDKRAVERKKLSQLLRLATVDNFQGEEAKIVIISLVRCNRAKNVGFLRTSNRVNVLLSRAQYGMYLIGSAETYSSVEIWDQILGMLEAQYAVGRRFELCCPRHEDKKILVYQPEDFAAVSPEGGCQLRCDRPLNKCGHMCTQPCHAESMHRVSICNQPCERRHDSCNHICQKVTCGEDCGSCTLLLDGVILPCGHSNDQIPCYQTQNLSTVPCTKIVEKEVPGCEHQVRVNCSQDVMHEFFRCPAPCDEILSTCGHTCPGICSECNPPKTTLIGSSKDKEPEPKHASCKSICSKPLKTCNHKCRQTCHPEYSCGLCFSTCEVACVHAKCTKPCRENCKPCHENCAWSCGHKGECQMPCSAPCDRLPCDERCSKNLNCGHRCSGLCGELCRQSLCQLCSQKADLPVNLGEINFSEVNLDDSPIIALGCGHLFTPTFLDRVVGLSTLYVLNEEGNATALKDVATNSRIPSCPMCAHPLKRYDVLRYGRIVNKAINYELNRRLLATGLDDLRSIEVKVRRVDYYAIETSAGSILPHLATQINAVSKNAITRALGNVHERSKSLEAEIISSLKRMSDRYEMNMITLDLRITLTGEAKLLKLKYVISVHTLNVAQALMVNPSGQLIKIPGKSPDELILPFFQECIDLLRKCIPACLPKLAMEVALYYALVARPFNVFCQVTKLFPEEIKNIMTQATLLLKAVKICQDRFQRADELHGAINAALLLLAKPWDEVATQEELDAVKVPLMMWSEGIAFHDNDWLKCKQGHAFSPDEWISPIDGARCSECGAAVAE